MNYIFALLSALSAIAVIAVIYVNIPLMSSIVTAVFDSLVTIFIAPIIIEVGLVIFLLRKKSLRLFRLTLLLFLANCVSFYLFVLHFPSLFDPTPAVVIILSAALVVLFETLVLIIATELTVFRKAEGFPLNFKGAFVPIFIGNIVFSVAFYVFFRLVFSPPLGWGVFDKTAAEKLIQRGQGTWEVALEARDLDNDIYTIEAYYDTVLDITWLTDANYSKTKGDHKYGQMSLSEANAWITSLDINGVTGWRLPKLRPINGIVFDDIHSNDATTDNGYAHTTTDGTDGGWRDISGNPVSEMGHMYYVTLGNISRCSPDFNDQCVHLTDYELYNAGIKNLFNVGAFSNIQRGPYWTNPVTDSNPGLVTAFLFDNGKQGFFDDIHGVAFVWAVHDGDVGAPISK